MEAAHFNHGLRGDEAQRDEEFVRAQCVRWQVPLTVGRGDVGDFARREGQTIEEAARTLREVQGRLEITAARHGVPAGETANELYHILFGGINEELVRRGLTAAPPDRPGEGRYLQCIKW